MLQSIDDLACITYTTISTWQLKGIETEEIFPLLLASSAANTCPRQRPDAEIELPQTTTSIGWQPYSRPP